MAARDKDKRREKAERKFQGDLKKIDKKYPPGSAGRLIARSDRKYKQAKKLKNIESGKGCAVTAIAAGLAIVSGIAAWRGWA
jgi:hypothetical protein